MPFRFKFHPNGRNSDRPSGDNRVESGLAPVSMLPRRGTYERGCILERIRDVAPILRRVVFAFHGYARHDAFPSVVRSFPSFVSFVRSRKKEREREREEKNEPGYRKDRVICVCEGKRWKRGGKKRRDISETRVRCALGVTESAKYNPERLEVMIDRWRIEGSCPATFLRVPSQGHSTPWNPEPAWNRAVVAELFRSRSPPLRVSARREESSQRYGAQKKKRART